MKLVTLPHTGTHWALKLLGRMGIQAQHTHLFKNPLVIDGPTVITLRDPLLAEITCINRGPRYQDKLTAAGWRGIGVWRELLEVADYEEVFFLSIEHPDWRGLAKFTGGSLPTEVPAPLNTTEDKTGMRTEYGFDYIPEILEFEALWLRDHMTEFFVAHEYHLPWML